MKRCPNGMPIADVSDEVPYILEWLNSKRGTARLILFSSRAGGEIVWQRAVHENTGRRFAMDNWGNRIYEDGEVYEV